MLSQYGIVNGQKIMADQEVTKKLDRIIKLLEQLIIEVKHKS